MAPRQQSTKGKKQVEAHDYGWFPGVLISRELLESDAWADLEHAERAVLIDMIWVAGCAKGEPFFFTWAHCKTPTTEATFKRARERLCLMGFLKARPDLKELKTGPDLFSACGKWRKHRASENAVESQKRKTRRIAASRGRRRRMKLKSNHPDGVAGTHPDGGDTGDCNHPDGVYIGAKRPKCNHPDDVFLAIPVRGAVSVVSKSAEIAKAGAGAGKRPELATLRGELAQFFDGLTDFPEMPFNRKADLFTGRVARALGQDTKPVNDYLRGIRGAGDAAFSTVAKMIEELLQEGLPLTAIGGARNETKHHTVKGGAVDEKKAAAQ
ncbi:MAG TPA: hypothetical protein VMZ06_13190 [Candidatus Bathyarchaeia archaeon]|nr:hypothetical protein [Candidatus Bathyarchaeia archaeon]